MTARDIQRRLIADLYRKVLAIPNYTPAMWFECDVMEITAAGYFREYEIKISYSDFKADAHKIQSRMDSYNQRKPAMFKHDMLAANHFASPSQFWYVVPASLAPTLRMPGELPSWAGLIVAELNEGRPPYNVRLTEIVKAPKRHRIKADPKIEQHARGVCYWRLMKSFTTGKYESGDEQ